MTLVAVLPRGIDLGARNRVSMPVLRTALAEAGFTGVRTHVASGNVVVEADDRTTPGTPRGCSARGWTSS